MVAAAAAAAPASVRAAAEAAVKATAVTAATATTVTAATTSTAGVQVGKDKFKEIKDNMEGDTLLLSMWESKKPCEPKALNAAGQEVQIEIAGMTITKAPGGQDMTLSAWIGTGITKVDRKKDSLINYVAVIVKKAEVQAWSEVEAHLWQEYNENWNKVK